MIDIAESDSEHQQTRHRWYIRQKDRFDAFE